MPVDASQMAQQLLEALEMHDLGVEMMVESLRRRFPAASEAEIEERLIEWLRDDPPDLEGPAHPGH